MKIKEIKNRLAEMAEYADFKGRCFDFFEDFDVPQNSESTFFDNNRRMATAHTVINHCWGRLSQETQTRFKVKIGWNSNGDCVVTITKLYTKKQWQGWL